MSEIDELRKDIKRLQVQVKHLREFRKTAITALIDIARTVGSQRSAVFKTKECANDNAPKYPHQG